VHLRDNNLINKGVMYEYENSNINSLDWHHCALVHRKSIYVQCGSSIPNVTYVRQGRIAIQLNDLSRQYYPFSCRVLFQTEGISKDMQEEVMGAMLISPRGRTFLFK
jgi:hypothetical protein